MSEGESMVADETAEDRLESALERIAALVASREAGEAGGEATISAPHPATVAVAERLDQIIATLRDALGK